MNEQEYNTRAGWDCGQQMRALRALLASVGCSTELAVEIDDIYRPSLETLEAERNEAQDALSTSGSPVVEQQPQTVAWKCERPHVGAVTYRDSPPPPHWSNDWLITPLYAAPCRIGEQQPRAQTISEAEAKQLRRDAAGLELALLRADELGCVKLLGGEAHRILDFLKKQLSYNDGSGESDGD